MGSKHLDVLHKTVYLYPGDIEIAKQLGKGNLSNGVRLALRIARYVEATPLSKDAATLNEGKAVQLKTQGVQNNA